MTSFKLYASILLSLLLLTACQPLQNVAEPSTSETLPITEENNKIIELRTLAEQGDASAQFELALMYDDDESVELNDRKAVKWYQKAANQGHAGAQNILGVMYNNGEGVHQDYTKAVEWYQKAANQDNVWAQFNLGTMYEDGKGVHQDYTKAVEWYQKAANQGDEIAQYNLGVMYEPPRVYRRVDYLSQAALFDSLRLS